MRFIIYVLSLCIMFTTMEFDNGYQLENNCNLESNTDADDDFIVKG